MVVYLLMIESFEQVPIEARRLLFTFISGRPAPRWERHVQLWRRGRAWVSDGRVVGKERRRSVPTALVESIDLPPRGRQRACVSVCFARAEYIDVMLMPAGSSFGTRCMVKVNEPFNESTWWLFCRAGLDNYSVLLLLLLLRQQLSTLHDD
jgi:hypothetical protein